MNITSLQTNFANAVSPFNPVGKQPVGEENAEDKNSTLKAVEESAESAHGENRTADDADSVAIKDSTDEENDSRHQHDKKRRETKEQQEIRELAARDREVHNHEQAHASVGGQYAGSPRYELKRGPDGVSYAVGGEVSISTSEVGGDPEATIAKAQQVHRAALAPADPSPQDRRVAARAAQMEVEARKELLELTQEEVRAEREQREQQQTERQQEEQQQEQRGQELQQEHADRAASFKENSDRQRSFQQRLIDIGVAPVPTPVGSIISEAV